MAATVVHVSTVEQGSEKQESKAKITPDSNGFTHAQNQSKHDRQNGTLPVVTKNGEVNCGFEPNSTLDQVTIGMSGKGTRADDNPDVTLTHFRPITEQNGTMDPNNSNSLCKPGFSMKGGFHLFCNYFQG